MVFVSLLLWVLLLPLCVLTARGTLGGAASSPLRRCCTVLSGFAVFGVFFYFLESAAQSMAYYADFGSESGDYLRYLMTALLALYWMTVVAAEVVARQGKGRALGWAWPLGGLAVLIAHGGAALAFYLGHEASFAFTGPVVGAAALLALLGWANLILPFDKKWQRGALTAVNVLVCGAQIAAAVWALREGFATLGEGAPDTLFTVLIGLAALLLLAPALLCAGSIVAAYLRGDGDDDAEVAYKE